MTLEVLQGHTTADTAYVVDDYPYGFRLRCKIRYWLEFNPKHGFRLVSQTTNPKISGREAWNKPKASTYANLAVMGLDEQGHVTWTGIHYPERADMEKFHELYGAHFDDSQRDVYARIMAAIERYEKRKAAASSQESNS